MAIIGGITIAKIFGQRQYLRTLRRVRYSVKILKALIEIIFEDTIAKITIKFIRRVNRVTGEVTVDLTYGGKLRFTW